MTVRMFTYPSFQSSVAIVGLVIFTGLVPLQAAGAQTPDFYDLDTVRTIYLTFNQSNWWQLLEQNYRSATDIEADMTVDSTVYPRVGVRFRGNTSYTQLPSGCQKKGFNITTDAFVPDQEVLGYHSLNLNNGFHDPTFMREVIMYQICRRYMSAPKANFVKLYLNNEYWDLHQRPAAQQGHDAGLVRHQRWKSVPGISEQRGVVQ